VIIFLYGPDSYRRKRKLDEILAHYTQKQGAYTIQSFDGDDDDARMRLAAAVNAQSLFGATQLFVVRNYFPVPEKFEKPCELFLRAALEAREYTLVILADDIPKKRFAFIAARPAIVQEFATLAGAAFESFIKQEASRVGACLSGRKARMTPALLQALARAYDGDSWGVVSELERLALGGEIAAAQSPAANVFAAAGALASGQGVAYPLPPLERLLLHEDAAYVFNCLAYYMRGADKLRFADYDVAVKSGRALYDTALLEYVLF
jgi:hypothetical protein